MNINKSTLLRWALLWATFASAPAGAQVVLPMPFYLDIKTSVSLPDGRKLAFYCLGQGAPTVILTAGAGDWSATSWGKVQASIAKTTRVCAWDRPGFGYSDPSPDMSALGLVGDLSQGLAAARIGPPYVMVGHSIGSFETRLFTDLHPGEVVGMVLIDGSLEHQTERQAAVSPKMTDAAKAVQSHDRACTSRFSQGEISPNSPDFDQCVRTGGKPVVALIDAMNGVSAAQLDKARRSYGALPMVVLTASLTPNYLPGAPAEEIAARQTLWDQMQDELAALSAASEHKVIEAHHYIQLEKPQVVIDAVNSVVEKAKPQR